MRIGVCFKIVPDYEELTSEEWENIGNPDFTYVKKMYGCFDEAALEMGLTVKDLAKESGQQLEAVAVTAGPSEGSVTEGLLRGLFAAGYDDVVILNECDSFNPFNTAQQLASYFKNNPVDYIFTGKMVGPFESGMVPYYLAKELNFDINSELKEGLYPLKENTIYAVGDSNKPYLRLFPLKARMEAKKKSFSIWQSDADSVKTAIELRYRKPKEKECKFVVGDAHDGAAFLKDMIQEAK